MAKESIYISNTSQGIISLNCSYVGECGEMVAVFHDIPPARVCIGISIPKEDWNRVKHTQIVQALVDTKILLPEKKKVMIDQETWKASDPQPTGELAEASLNNLTKANTEATTVVGSRKSRTKLKG